MISLGIDPSLQAQVLKQKVIEKGYWICSKCLSVLPRTREHFSANNAMEDGMRPECDVCRKNTYYNKTIPTKQKDPDWNRAKFLSYNTRWRAKSQNVPIDKNFAEAKNLYKILREVEYCECCGKKLEKEFKGEVFWENKMNLDKIVPSKGYVIGNTAWLCGKCNRIKLNANPEEVRRVADWMQRVWPPSVR